MHPFHPLNHSGRENSKTVPVVPVGYSEQPSQRWQYSVEGRIEEIHYFLHAVIQAQFPLRTYTKVKWKKNEKQKKTTDLSFTCSYTGLEFIVHIHKHRTNIYYSLHFHTFDVPDLQQNSASPLITLFEEWIAVYRNSACTLEWPKWSIRQSQVRMHSLDLRSTQAKLNKQSSFSISIRLW